ncbi:hypothetical protein ASG85_13335 [Paenibacillus sp. Soil724D2]|nr:hypothetical protein ASG85_13335 [Paenibacillus sp. Soil724D2]
MRAVVYPRVSTQEQVAGYSLDKQEEECIKYIKNAGHELVDVYRDEGYSAKDMNRPGLQRMLADIPKRTFDMIVVWHTDRLTRDVIDGLTMVKNTFNQNGIKFASVTEDIDTTTYDGMMMLTMRLMMGQRERERIGERVSMGQAKKATTGRRVSLASIYGYDAIQGKLVVNENEAEIVKRIFNNYALKNHGLERIATELNSEGIPSKKSNWYAQTVKGILRNITYIGFNEWKPKFGDPIITKGEHEAIVDEEVFELAQSQQKRRRGLEMSRTSYPYPFSSIVKCGHCGGRYTANNRTKYGKTYVQYLCANRRPGICKAEEISGLKLEKLFFDYFTTIRIEADPYTTKEEVKQFQKEKTRIEREIAKLEGRKNNLLDALGDKIISREDYKKKVEEINESLSRLNRELHHIEPQEIAATRSPDEIISFVRNLQKDWDLMQPEDKKFMIQMLFKRIVIKKSDKWEILEMVPV